MKVAIVHDYLRQYRDAEGILRVLHRLYPNAPIYTAFVDYQQLGNAANHFAGWDIRPTVAQRLPGISRFHAAYRLWLSYFWESLDLSSYDLVISLSGDYLSQAVLTRSQALHVSYCLSPPRHLWEPIQPNRNGLTTWANIQLRRYDFDAAQRADRLITTSEVTARRIRKFYRRAAEVIHPPVQVRGEGMVGTEYYLYVGALDCLQQVDLVVKACQQLDRPLWVVGTGSELKHLKQMAGSNIRFLGNVPEAERAAVYQGAIALLYPTMHEDFAFAPVEALGYGIPVIASNLSGMKDIILNYRTGLLFAQPTVESLSNAILQFENLRFSSQACIQRAEEFAESVFTAKFEWFIAKALDDHHGQSTSSADAMATIAIE